MLDATPATCENCATPLQGAYCHACGQHAVNPLRDFAHAFEEVFESFWHLDGRAFRTLRELLVPGRVACNYLAGHRARYIPPLRLFLVLVVLTFFVGHFIAGGIDDTPRAPTPVQVVPVEPAGQPSTFRTARSDAEVQAVLDRELANVAEARRRGAVVPGMGMALDAAETQLRNDAQQRRAQLAGNTGPAPASAATASVTVAPGAVGTPPTKLGKNGAEVADTVLRKLHRAHFKYPKQPWDAKTNPVHLNGLPTLADHWLNHRIGNVADNIDRIVKGGQSVFLELMLAAVPSALFVLVPVFALLLRVFYLFSGRSYLEHLVVALYSHAFLLLTLFATFVLMLLPLGETLTGWGVALLWMWAAAYVLLMQKRVYGQRWPITTLKYVAIGFLYQFLLVGGLLYAVFAGISSSG